MQANVKFAISFLYPDKQTFGLLFSLKIFSQWLLKIYILLILG